MKSPGLPAKPVLRAGAVFQYAYLWRREFMAGQTEGRKDRPALALAVAVSERDGRSHVLAVPITHSQPTDTRHGVALPQAAKRMFGLDDAPSWVITTEAARFAWPGADVRVAPGRTHPIYGFVGSLLLKKIVQSFLENRASGAAESFDRYD